MEEYGYFIFKKLINPSIWKYDLCYQQIDWNRVNLGDSYIICIKKICNSHNNLISNLNKIVIEYLVIELECKINPRVVFGMRYDIYMELNGLVLYIESYVYICKINNVCS